MAVYDVKINGLSLTTSSYAVDEFTGRRVIPERRQVEVVIPGNPGASTYLGEYQPHHFKLGMWVAGGPPGSPATPAGLEANLDKIMAPLVRRGLVRVEWLDAQGLARYANARLIAAVQPEIDHNTSFGRLELLFANDDVFWQGTERKQTSSVFNAPVSLLPATTGTGVDFKAKLTINGPISNPEIVIGDHSVKWTGSIAAGQWISFDNAALRAENNSRNSLAPYIQQTHNRYFDIEPGTSVLVKGSATTASSGWVLDYRSTYS